MKKIIVFAGSNHRKSINRCLAVYASNKLPKGSSEILDLSFFNPPMYSEDLERKDGIPLAIRELMELFLEADGFLIAVPEHNGLLPAFFKNIIDWMSRIEQQFFNQKPVLLLSTSPGHNGGQSGLRILSALVPKWGGVVIDTFSLGSFYKNFDIENNRITDEADENRLVKAISEFEKAIIQEIRISA
ncbi:MAG: NAD(P)H-dependent oxidoreductase [Pricia sp.]|nr:NAD(P)H-dependent oxidoreductase [Pricia sp.]